MEGRNGISELRIERKGSGSSLLTLQDHIKGPKKTIQIDGEQYEVQYFENDYAEQYTLRRVGSSTVRLFENGVLLQEWNESNGKKNGNCTQYELGMVKQIQNWENLASDGDLIRILNTKVGSQVEFIDRTSGVVVYRGEYDRLIHRHGRGVEFDRSTGKELFEGYWKSGRLERVLKSFRANRMTEFKDEANVDVATRVPVYIGGYVYNQASNTFSRNGLGCSIDPVTRIATCEEEWENGVQVRVTELVNGWYKEPLSISSSALWRASVMGSERMGREKKRESVESRRRMEDSMNQNDEVNRMDTVPVMSFNNNINNNTNRDNGVEHRMNRMDSISDPSEGCGVSDRENRRFEKEIRISGNQPDRRYSTSLEDENELSKSDNTSEENFLSSDELLGIGSSSDDDEPFEIIVHQTQNNLEISSNREPDHPVTGLARSLNSGAEMETIPPYEEDPSVFRGSNEVNNSRGLNEVDDSRELTELSDSSSSGVHVTDTSDEIYY